MPNDDACPLNLPADGHEAHAIQAMLSAKRIVVVGLSDNSSRPSFGVARYLISHGKQIVPVNPNHFLVLGQTCYSSLKEVPGPIEVVNVFRRPEFCAGIVREAIRAGAKGVWLQSGIVSREAEELARNAAIWFVQDRCIMVEHMYLGQTHQGQ